MIHDEHNIPFPGEHECDCGCGHDHSHDAHDEGEFTPTVTLVDDNGNEVEFIFLDMVEHEGATYAALIPAEETDDDDMIIMRIDTDEDGNEFLSTIEDDDEFNAVAAEFVELLSDEFDFDVNADQQ